MTNFNYQILTIQICIICFINNLNDSLNEMKQLNDIFLN